MKFFDVLIIGSGPAGNTTAIYTSRFGFKTGIITGTNIGGQLTITTEVENFPGFPKAILGSELMDNMIRQSENLGVEIIYDNVNYVDLKQKPFICKTDNGEEYQTSNLVIATGAKAKWLGLKSETEFLGYGVSGCATCDGNFFRNKPVAVIGGGDTAGIEALHMANIASEVYIIYRKSSFIRMKKSLADKIFANNKIKIMFDSEVQEICGSDKPKKVEHINIINNKTNKIFKLDINAVFVAIGRKPENELFINSGLNFDKDGYIITEKDSARTNIKNVYVAGDISNKKWKQAVIAASYGCIAALEIQEDN